MDDRKWALVIVLAVAVVIIIVLGYQIRSERAFARQIVEYERQAKVCLDEVGEATAVERLDRLIVCSERFPRAFTIRELVKFQYEAIKELR